MSGGSPRRLPGGNAKRSNGQKEGLEVGTGSKEKPGRLCAKSKAARSAWGNPKGDPQSCAGALISPKQDRRVACSDVCSERSLWQY